jgi:hypothetical protein
MIGVYAEVYAPVIKGQGYQFTIQKLNSYSHNIAAIGGFWDASLSLLVGESKAEDWYEMGLGRQLKIKNQSGGDCWKGFVNLITITVGSQTFTRGPLLDVVNRAACVYTPRSFPIDAPPVDGSTTTTILVEDIPSQLNYGIMEKSTAGGATTDDNAEKARDVFLAQNRLPKTTGDFSISGVGQPLNITLDLLGNIHWLTVYPYNNLAKLAETVYDKLLQVIVANPNSGVFSTDYLYIDDNVFQAEQLEDKNRYAWDIVNELLSLGNDVDNVRRTLGLYENDKFQYHAAPTDIDYLYRLSTQRQRIVDYHTGATVHPWDVRPGKWIYTSDWLIGRKVSSTDLLSDPRNKFIENVNFSSPATVGLTGSPYDELAQMLSKITYTGGTY